MSVFYHSESIELPNINQERITAWIKEIAAKYDRSVGSVNYIFCSDEVILKVNREFLQHDYYTDIITFDYSTSESISGDIYISLETVETNAHKYNNNFMEELHRVIIHGILHLCGVNDKSAEEEQTMRAAEDDALAQL